jgi:hypothetical protein
MAWNAIIDHGDFTWSIFSTGDHPKYSKMVFNAIEIAGQN